MATPMQMMDIIRRKDQELGKDHDEKARAVFNAEALNLMEQNYILLNQTQPEVDDSTKREVNFRINIQTPEETNSSGQSQRAKTGVLTPVNLAEMSERAALLQGVVPSRYAVVTAMHLEDVRNLSSTDCVLDCKINDEAVGVHYTANNSTKRNEETRVSLSVAMAGQQAHLTDGGRMIYGHQESRMPIDKANVAKYLHLLGRNSIIDLTRIPPGSKAVEYTSPTARIKDVRNSDHLTCGDQFVNLMYRHPHLFNKEHKVAAINTPGEDGNEIVNVRMHKDDFTKIHDAVQKEILEPLRRHVIDLENPKPVMFKIVPTAKPALACADETDLAQNGAVLASGSAAWNTDALRDDKGPVSFGIKVTMQYI